MSGSIARCTFFAIIDVYSVLGVDSDAEVHIRALLDIFDIPYVIAELRNGRLDELTDGACRSLRTVFLPLGLLSALFVFAR